MIFTRLKSKRSTIEARWKIRENANDMREKRREMRIGERVFKEHE